MDIKNTSAWHFSHYEEIEARNFGLKAVNPNRKHEIDKRTPEKILSFIEAKSREVEETLAVLRKIRE